MSAVKRKTRNTRAQSHSDDENHLSTAVLQSITNTTASDSFGNLGKSSEDISSIKASGKSKESSTKILADQSLLLKVVLVISTVIAVIVRGKA